MGSLRRWLGFETPVLLPAREGYALWAETYPPRPHNPLMAVEQAVVAPILESLAPSRALDVGTGTGRYLPLLSSTGASLVVGLDISLAMLTHDRSETPRVCADSCRLPFADCSFDLVCSSLMVGDVRDLGAWIEEIARVLTPGGHVVYSDFHPSWSSQQWRRTFRTGDGRQYELAYFSHAIDEHLRGLERASLEVQTIREPRVAGRPAPVVAVFHATKSGLSPRGPATRSHRGGVDRRSDPLVR